MENCTQRDRIKRIEDKLDKHNKVLFEGNGSPAITVTLANLSLSVDSLNKNLPGLKTAMNGIHDYMKQYEGRTEAEKNLLARINEREKAIRWTIGVGVMIISVLVTLIIST
jgi:predicted phosphohydrolase